MLYTSIQPRCQRRLRNGLVMVHIGPCVWRLEPGIWRLWVNMTCPDHLLSVVTSKRYWNYLWRREGLTSEPGDTQVRAHGWRPHWDWPAWAHGTYRLTHWSHRDYSKIISFINQSLEPWLEQQKPTTKHLPLVSSNVDVGVCVGWSAGNRLTFNILWYSRHRQRIVSKTYNSLSINCLEF